MVNQALADIDAIAPTQHLYTVLESCKAERDLEHHNWTSAPHQFNGFEIPAKPMALADKMIE
jgi:hypothetical protein